MMFMAQNYRMQTADKTLDWCTFWTDKSLFTQEHVIACYQPNVTALFNRMLFKYFHDEGMIYKLADFNFIGGFQAYWTELFALVKEKRPDEYGERPNKAHFDPNSDFKN